MIIVEGVHHINIPVTDLAASKKFYSELFDFEIIDDSHKNYVIMGLDPIQVKLNKQDKVENSLSDSLIPMVSFSMDVDDFTDAIAELEEKKIKIIKGPEGLDDGEFLVFADPDNNLIEVFYQS